MLEDHLDQASFAGPKVPMNAAARQAMQDRNRLLNEQLFEFVDGHFIARSSQPSAISWKLNASLR
jgi:hypothetical protein